ncbi:hypothetical protein Calab_3183 [Caldithrix abyssi DSM 13497]|uniref:Uncharacterized protein n=1 Tax=Caldithrix abyssi DSM 13497 TaxID=880073 RepID=H1XUG3_CALAY|nr:hypothetical protein [Caldithrix abyssi]APF18814.1 hypothetical protein Cabys_2065 [Caldithrix abyssi DSM 13497]EHO42789.1 hypothetical protein Calab_3183 [Caldithrix abyssi DSM 13497]
MSIKHKMCGKPGKVILLLFLLWLKPDGVYAFDYSFSGYVKYLYSNTKLPYFPNRFNDHLLHSRLNGRFYLSTSLTFVAETRWRTYYAESIETLPSIKNQITQDYPLIDLGQKVIDSGAWFSYLELDRLYLDYAAEKWQFTAGRQRIAWGTSLVWNVIDLFNPLSILDFDYEERPGSDALRFQYFTGSLSRLEVAYQPARSPQEQTFALLCATHYGEYDFYFLAGSQNKRKTLGMAWAGYVKDAGFRGEIRWSEALYKSGKQPPPIPFFPSLTDNKKNMLQMVLSADYAFSNSFYVHTEALYNRSGLTQNAGLYQTQAQQLGLLTVSRWSLFQEFAYDLHPLVRLDVFALFNPNDRSYLIAPSVSWSALTNLDLYLIGFFSGGNALSEFGSFGRAAFCRLKWSF